MAKAKKPVKDKLEKVRKDYHDKLPDSERNPNHKEDFGKALETLFPPIKRKGGIGHLYIKLYDFGVFNVILIVK